MNEIKELKGLCLPIFPGREAIIYLADGSIAQTFPRNINNVIYNKGYLWVDFNTTNSRYRGYLIVDEPTDEMFDEQIIRQGELVNTTDGDLEVVKDIIDIREDGIYIRTQKGYYKGLIKLRESRPA